MFSVNELIVSDFTLMPSNTTVTVTWSPSAASAYVGRYEVQWRIKGVTSAYNTKDVGLANSTTLESGLSRDEAYDVRVVSVDTVSQIDEQSVDSDVKSVSLSKL